jgi:hypothetical protein
VGLDVLLEILGALEGLATELAFVRLERDMDANMRSDVIALDGRGTTLAPGAGQVEVVGRFATDVALTDMLLLKKSACAIKCRERYVHREPLRMDSARRILATGTADFHPRLRLMRVVERQAASTDLAEQVQSLEERQVARPEPPEATEVVRRTCCRRCCCQGKGESQVPSDDLNERRQLIEC